VAKGTYLQLKGTSRVVLNKKEKYILVFYLYKHGFCLLKLMLKVDDIAPFKGPTWTPPHGKL